MGEEEVEPVEPEEPSSHDTPLAPSEDVDPAAALRLQLEEAQRLADTFKRPVAAESRGVRKLQAPCRIGKCSDHADRQRESPAYVVAGGRRLCTVDESGKRAERVRCFLCRRGDDPHKIPEGAGEYGVVPFSSAGKPFDVGFHDALLQIPRNDLDPHTVVEEVERGYMLYDRVLRHAKVIVSTVPEAPEESNGQA